MMRSLVERPQLQPDKVFREFYSHFCRIVRRAGIPRDGVEDVVSEIVLKMLQQDSFKRFDWAQSHKLKAYLSSYVNLSSKAWLSRHIVAVGRSGPQLDLLAEVLTQPDTGIDESDAEFLTILLTAVTDPDARVFLQRAFDTLSYHDARAQLLADGWDHARVSLAVRRARAGTKKVMCTK